MSESFEKLFEEIARVALRIVNLRAPPGIQPVYGLEFVTKQAPARGNGNGGATLGAQACPTRLE